MDQPWQTGGAQQAHANLKKATHEQAFLVHASSRKLYARASHRSLARQSHVSIDQVAQLDERKLAALKVGARITGFLTILTIWKVREILQYSPDFVVKNFNLLILLMLLCGWSYACASCINGKSRAELPSHIRAASTTKCDGMWKYYARSHMSFFRPYAFFTAFTVSQT